MCRSVVVAVLAAVAVASVVWAGVPIRQTAGLPTAKAALLPGVISLVDIPPGTEDKQRTLGGQLSAIPKSPGKMVAATKGDVAAPLPLPPRQALQAIQQLPGGEGALGQVEQVKSAPS